MWPTILTRRGKVAMVIGTPGGSRIFTSVFQLLTDVYDFHLPLHAAMAAPRFHHQLLPDNLIYAEPAVPLPATLVKVLVGMGYRVETQDFSGDIAAIEIEGAMPVAAADPRARGVALMVP
jgi:gamma-glutamyltranspeptidase/glutathione hydrolase